MSLFKKVRIKCWDYIASDWYYSDIDVMSRYVLDNVTNVPVVTQLTNGDVFYPISRDYNRSLLKNFLVDSIKEGKVIKQTTKPSKANIFIDSEIEEACTIKPYNYIVTKDGTKYEIGPIANELKIDVSSAEETRRVRGFAFLEEFYYDQKIRLKIIEEDIRNKYLTHRLNNKDIDGSLSKVIEEMVSIEYDVLLFLNRFAENRLEFLATAIENKPGILRLKNFQIQLFGIKEKPMPQGLFSKIERYIANNNTRSIGLQLLLKYDPYINEFVYRYLKSSYNFDATNEYPHYDFISKLNNIFHSIGDYNTRTQFQNYQLNIIEGKFIDGLAKDSFLDTTSIKLDRARIKEKFKSSPLDIEEPYKYFYKKEDDRE